MQRGRQTTQRQITVHPRLLWKCVCFSVRILLRPSRKPRHCCQIRRLRISYSHAYFSGVARRAQATTRLYAYSSGTEDYKKHIYRSTMRPFFYRNLYSFPFGMSSRWVDILSRDDFCSAKFKTPRMAYFRGVARRSQAVAQPMRTPRLTANILVEQCTFRHATLSIVAPVTCGQLSVALGVAKKYNPNRPKLYYLNIACNPPFPGAEI